MDIADKDIIVRISRMKFFEEWEKYPKNNREEELLRYVLAVADEEFATIEDLSINYESLKLKISRISDKISKRWEICSRKRSYFLKKYSSWLDADVFEISFSHQEIPNTSVRTGRPEKSFTECSEKTKKRKVSALREVESEKLAYAAQLSLYAAGQRKASKLVKNAQATLEQPSTSTCYLKKSPSGMRCFSPVEALALLIDCKLTKASYTFLRQRAREVEHDLYPPYYKLLEAKKACIPGGCMITQCRAEVPLQGLLDLTAHKLCALQLPVLKQLIEMGHSKFELYSKWGCDGSGGHKKYHQKFSSDNQSDENIFMFSLVPLNLVSPKNQSYVWKNNVPGSTRYCRPIKFMFQKETTSLIFSETELVKQEVQALIPTKFNVEGTEISVAHTLALTMLDGKACNALTDTKSTQTCYICKATPKVFQDPSYSLEEDPAITENYSFGLATLHGWIRTFEFLLNISYRLTLNPLKKTLKTEDDRLKFSLQKAKIQKEFKNQLGLNVDQPKQGFGNTNDGNMARRFFKESAVSATITGIDEALIIRFRVILQTLSSGYEINVDNFREFTQETKRLYFENFSWYGVTPTIHKIFDHSAEIIKNQLVPIGQLTEEAQEARNKDLRNFREHNTRKNSREDTNRDLLNMLLVSSDPEISSMRKPIKKKTLHLDSDVRNLLTDNQPPSCLSREESSESEDDFYDDSDNSISSDDDE